jgi:hypothetical protein
MSQQLVSRNSLDYEEDIRLPSRLVVIGMLGGSSLEHFHVLLVFGTCRMYLEHSERIVVVVDVEAVHLHVWEMLRKHL